MKIGIAYDLREDYLAEGYGDEETAEFDRLDTIEAIEGTLRKLGFGTERIGNIRSLAARLVARVDVRQETFGEPGAEDPLTAGTSSMP